MENIEALQKLERGEKLDQETLMRLHNEQLIHITEVTNMQSPGPEFIFVGFTPQGFGLLERSKAPLVSDLERQILHAVVRGFLDRHEATPTKAPLKRFKSALSTALQRLSHRGVLNVANNTYLSETYLPTSVAFHHCGDSAALAFARRGTETVLRVLPRLFDRQLDAEGDQQQYTAEDVLTEAKGFDSSIDPDAIFTGLYLAQEFSVFTLLRKDDRQVGIVSFSLGERVYEKQYLDWDQHIQQGNVALIYDQQSQLKKDAIPVSAPSNLELIVAEGLEPYTVQHENGTQIREVGSQRMNSLAVLISHSSKDRQLASALIDFLRSGLGLLPKQIRCSSVDGYRLPAGVHTDSQLRDEVTASKVLIGLITPNSLSSPYVLFEMGARWSAGETMIPLLAGVTADQLRGPLASRIRSSKSRRWVIAGVVVNGHITLTAVVFFMVSLWAHPTEDRVFNGDSNNPRDNACRLLLVITSSEAEPRPFKDCTICITCNSGPVPNGCTVIAYCNDHIDCSYSSCPYLYDSCTNNGGTVQNCDCLCSGSGTDVTWTDGSGRSHERVKNCPSLL